jgi:DNA-binding IclR family transcriptional regulator
VIVKKQRARRDGKEPDTAAIQSVERALDILFFLAEARRPVTVSEIAEVLEVHVSTASRLLSTLAQKRVVVQSRDGYRLDLGLLRLTHVVLNEMHVRTAAYPHLMRLSQLTHHSLYLAALHEGDELYLDQIETEEDASKTIWIGHTIPSHAASGGKVLLAYLADDALANIIDRGLVAATRFTITDPAKLREQLSSIRENGYAISRDEYLIGYSNVAAPIFDRSGQNIAVVSLSGPSLQLTPERLEALAPQVIATANAISLELGYNHLRPEEKQHVTRNKSQYRLTHH